ncbi:MAG: serine/threonine protein kinase [Acidimicrobiales bacterium]
MSQPRTADLWTGPLGGRHDYQVDPSTARRGGQGTVFEAYLRTDRLGGDLLDVKVGLKQLTGATSHRWAKLVERSGRLAQLRHPGLACHLEVFEGPAPCDAAPADDECDLHYAAHLWVEGTSLADIPPDTPAATVFSWIAQIADTLDFLHQHPDGPIAHRDLHPGNVIVTPDGKAVVIDYDTALPQEDTATTTLLVGSVGFIPPERSADKNAPAEAGDRWQLAMLAVNALLGNPQGALTATQLQAQLSERLAGRAPNPAATVAAITAMLAPNPADRPSECRHWASTLIAMPRRRWRRPVLAIAAAAAVVAAALALTAALHHGPPPLSPTQAITQRRGQTRLPTANAAASSATGRASATSTSGITHPLGGPGGPALTAGTASTTSSQPGGSTQSTTTTATRSAPTTLATVTTDTTTATTSVAAITPTTGPLTATNPTAPQAAPQRTSASDAETTGGVTNTWSNYTNAGGTEGPTISSNMTVQIACKLTGFKVADGNTWWYRIASSPWNNSYYASADAFYNNGHTSGSLSGTPFFDPNVPGC